MQDIVQKPTVFVLLWQTWKGEVRPSGIFSSEDLAIKYYAQEQEITEEEAKQHLFTISGFPKIVEVQLDQACDFIS